MSNSPSRALVLAAAVSLFFGGTTLAQTASSASPSATPDATFVKQASAAGLAEVSLGQLGAEKGTSQDIKTFGQTMVDDHTKAGDELKTIAAGKSIPVSTAPMPADAQAAAVIGKKDGAAFDAAFKTKMVADHEKVIKLFTIESTSGKDAELKAFATKTLPTLQHHLEMARQLPTK
jgi:putative membrane protein